MRGLSGEEGLRGRAEESEEGAEAGVCEDGVEKEEGVKTRRRRGGERALKEIQSFLMNCVVMLLGGCLYVIIQIVVLYTS